MGHTPLSDAAAVARLHAAIRAELDAREANARAAISQAEAELEQIAIERGTLAHTEQMYGRYCPWPVDEENPSAPTESDPPPFSFRSPTEPVHGKTRQPRARFGPKRYRMLIAIRTFGRLSADATAIKTGLQPRRVKDQLNNDHVSGVLDRDEEGFELTPLGRELLSRFEAEKQRVGQSLPTFDDASADEDREEGEPEEQLGEEAA